MRETGVVQDAVRLVVPASELPIQVVGPATVGSKPTLPVPLVWYPRLLGATASQRENWKIAGGGFGIHWPDIDEDLSTEGLLRGAPAPRAG